MSTLTTAPPARKPRRPKPANVLTPAPEAWDESDDADDGLARPPSLRMSAEAFDKWLEAAGENAVRAEWADGKVIVMGSASFEHNAIIVWLILLVAPFVEERGLGVVSFDNMIRLPDGRRLPDLYFVAEARRSIIGKASLTGPVDLAVEVVSPDSAENDYVDKFRYYAKIGVREYWIIDPQNRLFAAYRLTEANEYEVIPLGEDERFHSAVLEGFAFRPADLWATPRPAASAVLAELAAAPPA